MTTNSYSLESNKDQVKEVILILRSILDEIEKDNNKEILTFEDRFRCFKYSLETKKLCEKYLNILLYKSNTHSEKKRAKLIDLYYRFKKNKSIPNEYNQKLIDLIKLQYFYCYMNSPKKIVRDWLQ